MSDTKIATKLNEANAWSKSHMRRIDKLEEYQNKLGAHVTSVATLVAATA